VPTWGDILKEANQLLPISGPQTFDILRRKYLSQLNQHTGRSTILYETRWTQTPSVPPEFVSITEEEMEGFMEVLTGLPTEKGLDIILHSPGGSPEATEALVTFIRSHFKHVRVIIPHLAMSAATMLGCSSERMVMGKQSFIGPIDPQIIIVNDRGVQSVPVQAIKDQFELGKEECKEPSRLPAWFPILQQYGPAMLVQCDNALNLSKELVRNWLTKYMFHGDPKASEKAKKISDILADHQRFKTHNRHIDREQARSFGLVIEDLEKDPTLEDLVLSVFHATSLTFNATPTAKLIENHLGKAWVKQLLTQQVVVQGPKPGQPSPHNPPGGPGPSG
jgi:hypothetical protein